jgi:hypothetical protein
MNMKSKLLFTLIFIIAIFIIFILFGVTAEVWDGACGHKEEFGFFAFYRNGNEDGLIAECTTGFMYGGLIQTLAAILALLGLVLFLWRKLVK